LNSQLTTNYSAVPQWEIHWNTVFSLLFSFAGQFIIHNHDIQALSIYLHI